jgi:hypothetical protein
MRAVMVQAGQRLSVDAPVHWVAGLLAEACPGAWQPPDGLPADIEIVVRTDHRMSDVDGWEPVTRGAYRRGGAVVLHNACGSGFDLRVRAEDRLLIEASWRPPRRDRLAAMALRSRFHLLVRAALVQYPAMWWAGRSGRVPLHAAAVDSDGAVALLAGPGGIGRSTLLLDALAAGGRACSDNLCVSDGRTVHGLVEPVRVEGGAGRRMPHGRREMALPSRVRSLVPDRVIVLRRDGLPYSTVRPLDPAPAADAMVAGTYMAGELRRYWAFAATLALGTGVGPAHPPIGAVAADLARQVPCWEVVLGEKPTVGLRELLAACGATAVSR